MKTSQPMQTQNITASKAQTDRLPSAPRLAIFVYGTLKSGQRNHDYFCGDAVDIRPATTHGRLYALPAGYPALVVPESHSLAHGTADPLADTATQARLAVTSSWDQRMVCPEGDWDQVHGELIELADPLRSLPPIDRLEGFHPGRSVSLYYRILLSVYVAGAPRTAWTYIMPGCAGGHRLREGVWP